MSRPSVRWLMLMRGSGAAPLLKSMTERRMSVSVFEVEVSVWKEERS